MCASLMQWQSVLVCMQAVIAVLRTEMLMCLFRAGMTDWLTADYWVNECWKRAKFNGRSVLLLPLPFSSLRSPPLPLSPPPASPCCSRKSNLGARMCVCVYLCVLRHILDLGINLTSKMLKQEVHDISKAVCARASWSIAAQGAFSRLKE